MKREDLKIGKLYLIDKEYANAGEVELISFGNYFCMVRDPDTGATWETMINRLWLIPEPKEKQ